MSRRVSIIYPQRSGKTVANSKVRKCYSQVMLRPIPTLRTTGQEGHGKTPSWIVLPSNRACIRRRALSFNREPRDQRRAGARTGKDALRARQIFRVLRQTCQTLLAELLLAHGLPAVPGRSRIMVAGNPPLGRLVQTPHVGRKPVVMRIICAESRRAKLSTLSMTLITTLTTGVFMHPGQGRGRASAQ